MFKFCQQSLSLLFFFSKGGECDDEARKRRGDKGGKGKVPLR